MGKKEKMTSTEETISSKEETTENYEVGYGKPPKHTRFQKGLSGNPNGRSKKSLDFGHELLREAKSPITLNENGHRRRISKHAAVIKQLINNAMKGSTPAQRTYFGLYLPVIERAALSAAQQASDLENCNDVKLLTDEQLMWIAAQGLKKPEEEK